MFSSSHSPFLSHFCRNLSTAWPILITRRPSNVSKHFLRIEGVCSWSGILLIIMPRLDANYCVRQKMHVTRPPSADIFRNGIVVNSPPVLPILRSHWSSTSIPTVSVSRRFVRFKELFMFDIWLEGTGEHSQARWSTKIRGGAPWQDSFRDRPPCMVVIHGGTSERNAMVQVLCIPLIFSPPWLLPNPNTLNMWGAIVWCWEGDRTNWKGIEKLSS